MRLRIVSILLSLVFIVPLAMAKDYKDIPREAIFNSKDKRFGHLEYIGFYGSAMQHWNFTRELSPFTNLTWLATSNVDEVVLRIREAEQSGVQVVLSVQPFIFDAQYQVKPDYMFRLSSLQQRLEFENLTKNIAMVYPVDEPYLNATISAATTREAIYQELLLINPDLKELFPGVPLGVIFNSSEVRRADFEIPQSYSWIGFDCYDDLYDCNGSPITDYYSTLLQHMTPEQRLMAVPQSYVQYRDYEREFYEPREWYENRIKLQVKNLKKRLKHHYEIALSEPRFVAFIPFIWSIEPAPGKPRYSGFGADQFETMYGESGRQFVEVLTKISREIKTDSYVYPNLSRKHTESSRHKPRNRYEGEILDVSGNGLVSAWGINSALPHKNLRMQLVVESDGQEVYASKIRRSFILDTALSPEDSNELPAIGIHGYRHKLPKAIARELRGTTAVFKLRIYGDRATRSDYHEIRREVVL